MGLEWDSSGTRVGLLLEWDESGTVERDNRVGPELDLSGTRVGRVKRSSGTRVGLERD